MWAEKVSCVKDRITAAGVPFDSYDSRSDSDLIMRTQSMLMTEQYEEDVSVLAGDDNGIGSMGRLVDCVSVSRTNSPPACVPGWQSGHKPAYYPSRAQAELTVDGLRAAFEGGLKSSRVPMGDPVIVAARGRYYWYPRLYLGHTS